MKSLLVLLLLSAMAFASNTYAGSANFSFNAQGFNLKQEQFGSQNYKIDYIVEALPAPKFDDSLFQFDKAFREECVGATSVNNSGVCKIYYTGNWVARLDAHQFPIYKITEVVTDLKTGQTMTRKLADVTATVNMSAVTTHRVVPDTLEEMQINIHVGSADFPECYPDSFKTNPNLESVPAEPRVCLETRNENAKLIKSGKTYEVAAPAIELKLQSNTYRGVWDVSRWKNTDQPEAENR